MLDRFSTLDYPPAQRTEAWRAHLSEALFVADYRPLSEEGIVSDHAAMSVDEGRVHSFASNGHVVDLTATAAGGSAPILYFTTVLSGRAMYWSRSAMEIAGPGDTLVYDPADPFFISFHDDTRLVLFESREGALPLADQWRRRPCARLRTGLARAGGAHGAPEALQHVYAGLRGGDREARLGEAADRLIRTLERAAAEALAPGHYSSAVEYIEARLHDPGLSVRELAAAVHLSERQLARVFAERGASPSGFIIEARMRRAERLLAAGDRSVREVATECGYASASHFSRTFSAHAGCSPAAFRIRRLRGSA